MKKTYRVNEIFYSLQGEGYFTGTAAVFLRLSGCNLTCSFCDTDHQFFTEYTSDEIVETLRPFPSRHIVITGGEPALQIDDELVGELHSRGWFIQIETNGTRPLPEGIDWVTCSPKPSGKLAIKRADELKIVFLGQDVETLADALPADNLYLQPCSDENTEAVVEYIKSHPWWRLSLQTHKLINIP